MVAQGRRFVKTLVNRQDIFSRRIATALLLFALAVLTLLPRTADLDDFYTIDEAYHWPDRVTRFSAALAAGNWGNTYQTGHPGVTTMWLGSLGALLAKPAGVAPPGPQNDGAAYLAWLRLPPAIANSLALLAGYLLLRRLLDPRSALLAALLWATSPFLIAHSRLLHTDALLTSFMTLAVLLLLYALLYAERQRRPAMIASGVCAGLALLTKTPALALLPFTGLLLAWLYLPAGLAGLRQALGVGLLWLSAALLTVVLLWPALWVNPGAVLAQVAAEISDNGLEVHGSGNFFWGEAHEDPGRLFYPAVLLWRSAPLTLIGLLLLPLALRHPAESRRMLSALLAFGLIFGLLISLGAKKFDRYLLPIWPTLHMLAAAGLAAAAAGLYRRIGALQRIGTTRLVPAALLATLAIAGAGLLTVRPYYLAYFNPLLGGSATGQHVLLVGWGEGMAQVGAWLNHRPDRAQGPTFVRNPPLLAPFTDAPLVDLHPNNLDWPANYAVFYIRHLQRDYPPGVAELAAATPPLHRVQINGIEYATIHQLPRPYQTPHDAEFAGAVALRGFSMQHDATGLLVTPSWNMLAARPGGVFAFVHVLAPDGSRVGQIDVPIDGGLFSEWQAGQQFATPMPVALPPDRSPGKYRVVLGLYEPNSGARLPLSRGTALPEAIAGPATVELLRFDAQ
jgi:4-amino-4-deoxy-L-arabinose transferase-like glycosyltransferase